MQLITIDAQALANLNRALIGFYRIFSDVENRYANTVQTNYPPYNILKHSENNFEIEIAVAGFGKQDVELTLEANKLLIKGQTTLDTLTEDGIDVQYLHKGIADRAFTRSFVLNDDVVVNNAAMVNGVLKIWLEHIIPEDKKPRKIDITDDVVTTTTVTKK